MDVNWDAAKFWLDVAQWVVVLTVAIKVWVRNGQNLNKAAIETLNDELSSLDKRVLAFEKHLELAPTHEDISEVREEISGIKANLQQNTYMLQRVHDYLMNNKV